MSALVAVVCLILATAAVHVFGIYVLLRGLVGIRAQDFTTRDVLLIVLVLTLSIVTLHMIEVSLWAAFYRTAVDFTDWPTAMYLSLGSYTTVGAGEIILPRQWRLLEGAEAMVGALMFGLSIAFLFAVFNEVHRRWRESAHDAGA